MEEVAVSAEKLMRRRSKKYRIGLGSGIQVMLADKYSPTTHCITTMFIPLPFT
jgi:hypothetical protein